MDPAGQQLGVRLGSVDSLGAAGGGPRFSGLGVLRLLPQAARLQQRPGYPQIRVGRRVAVQQLRDSNLRLLLETAPKGFTPDWVRYEKGKGWQLKTEKPPIGSYDAIRVYLWAHR